MVYRLRMSPDDYPTEATAWSHMHANQQHASHRERAAGMLAPLLVEVEWLAFTSLNLGTASDGQLH
jgi:hypothetical protein